jgi:Ca2+-binding EF-hand superfamily protein
MKTPQMKVRMHCGLIAGAVLVVSMAASNVFAHEKMMGDMDMMKMMDTNHDGMVSAAEHAAYAKMMFDKIDTNHDGMVSQTEMTAGMKMMQGMGMHKGKMGNDHDADDSMKKSGAVKNGDGMSMHK